MNHFIRAVILFLATYAQVVCAEPSSFLVLKQHQNISHTEIKSIRPAWSLAEMTSGSRLVGFANISKTHNLATQETHNSQGIGVGLYQQHTSWLHSQFLVQQHPISPNQVQSLMEWMVDF